MNTESASAKAPWDFTIFSSDGSRTSVIQRLQAEAGGPRPDLNGVCMTQVPWGTGPVFMIEGGYRRGFTSATGFKNLYGTTPHRTSGEPGYVIEYADIAQIPSGSVFTAETLLITAHQQPVYLLDEGKKRGITSADLFNNTYVLDWGSIKVLDYAVLKAIPNGTLLPPRS